MTKSFEDNVADTSYILDNLTLLPRADPPIEDTPVLDLFSLKGKVCVVTGAGQGIGYYVAEAFAQAGGDVAFWDIYDPAEKAVQIGKKYGVKTKAYACDVTNGTKVAETVAEIEKDFGTIDVFVANAGINIPIGSIIDESNVDDSGWKKVMDINLNGVYYCSKYVGKVFKKHGKGSLIFTGSMSGHIINTPVYQAAYNASKAAVIHLAKSLAIEFTGFARVNTISPGYVNSGINDHLPSATRKRWWSVIPMGREGRCKELVGGYLYFASDASTYTTGSDLVIDGAFTVV